MFMAGLMLEGEARYTLVQSNGQYADPVRLSRDAQRALHMVAEPDTDELGILLTDSTNLSFTVRSASRLQEDDEAVMALGVIAQAENGSVDRGFVARGPSGWDVFWSATVGGVRQIFHAPILCE